MSHKPIFLYKFAQWKKRINMESLQKSRKLIKRIFLNKYLFVLVVFGVFITFFDENNLISRWNTSRKIAQLERELKFHQEEIEKNKQKMSELQSSDEDLEKFAREQFFMKKDDEEIFIIKE